MSKWISELKIRSVKQNIEKLKEKVYYQNLGERKKMDMFYEIKNYNFF